MKKITFTFFFCMIISGVFATQDIYVATTGNDLNAGTQESPYATLAKAASIVSEDGAVIHVASGTYVFSETAIIQPFNQAIVGVDAANTIFDGNNAVALIDGITQMQTSSKKLSIQKIQFKNGYLGTGSILGGSAVRMGAQTSLEVVDCYFDNNNSITGTITWGGAIYFTGNELIIDRCFFNANTSISTVTTAAKQGYGGAIAVRHLNNLGEAFHTPFGPTTVIIKNSTFYKNIGNTKGGAIYFNKQLDGTTIDDDDATFIVQNCVFLENTSTHAGPTAQQGAAIALSSGANNANNKLQSIVLTNNTFCNNNMVDASNNPLQRNTVLLEGFRYASYMANNLITSSFTTAGDGLFANQPAPIEYGMNNIIDKINVNIDGTDFTANAVAKNNTLAGGTPEALNLSTSLTGYPLGATFSVPYLTTTTGSPAINAGANNYLVNTIANPAPADPIEYVLQSDILGTAIQGASRDIGAFEYSISTTTNSEIANKYVLINETNGVKILNLNKSDIISVYNISGSLINRELVKDSQIFIPLSMSGIYIITVNGKATKHYFK